MPRPSDGESVDRSIAEEMMRPVIDHVLGRFGALA